MHTSDNLITLVVHSQERAQRLSEMLKFHGISATLEPLSLPEDDSLTPVKVRIDINDLPLGIKILESGDLNGAPLSIIKLNDEISQKILIPVDFSASSMLAVKVGFFLADKLQLTPVLLHAYIAPVYSPAGTTPDPFAGVIEEDDMEEILEDKQLRNLAVSRLSKFSNRVKESQASGNLPPIKFETELLEGVAEQVIAEYCKSTPPVMIVMSTRGVDKKGSDLIGSVTAEVIDSCRVPIFTVPDNYVYKGVDHIKRVALLCSMTSFDVATVRGLMRTFDYPACEVYLLPAYEKINDKSIDKLTDLKKFFNDAYPTANFHVPDIHEPYNVDQVKGLLDKEDIQIIIAPNKKSSVLSRFFKPTLAHKILFAKDIPMLALPLK